MWKNFWERTRKPWTRSMIFPLWSPFDRKRPGSFFKVPYLRWFLTYFVTYHINRSLDALNRRFHATAAVSGDPDSNWKTREIVKLYLRSLPRTPYRVLIFTAVLSALVIALPLQASERSSTCSTSSGRW